MLEGESLDLEVVRLDEPLVRSTREKVEVKCLEGVGYKGEKKLGGFER